MFDSRHGELPVASTMLTSALASAVPMAAVPCSTESATTGGVVDSLLLPPPQAPRKPAEVASAASRARRCLFMCFLVARQPSRSAPTCHRTEASVVRHVPRDRIVRDARKLDARAIRHIIQVMDEFA